LALNSAFLSGAAAGFATSVTSTLLSGGNLGDAIVAGMQGAVIGAFTSTATWGVAKGFGHETGWSNLGQKMLGHGLVQGISNEAQGGKFEHGFISGAFTTVGDFGTSNITSKTLNVTASAIASGTISELSGGKFANGAMSAAFIQLYNKWGIDYDNEKSIGFSIKDFGISPDELGYEAYRPWGGAFSLNPESASFKAGWGLQYKESGFSTGLFLTLKKDRLEVGMFLNTNVGIFQTQPRVYIYSDYKHLIDPNNAVDPRRFIFKGKEPL
jgi:hypothetical protein